MTDRVKALAAARKSLASAEKALLELQTAAAQQGAVVAELRKEATGDLTDAPLSDLMSQAGDIAVSQSRLTSAESVHAEIERRVRAQEPPVAEAQKRIRILQALGLEDEVVELEDKVLVLYGEIASLGPRVVALNQEIRAQLGITRQGAFGVRLLIDGPEMAERQHQDRHRLSDFGYKV